MIDQPVASLKIEAGDLLIERHILGGYFMFDRIVSRPGLLGGKPCIRGTRISVEMILEWIASGATRDEILYGYPRLTAEDIEQALQFAAHSVNQDIVATAEVGA